MAKVQDVKAYTRDVFTKAGLGDEVLQKVLGAFDDDKALKAFTDNFKPLPDYSHDMDDVRNRTKAEKDQEYKDWFDKEQQKYNEYLAGLQELDGYRKQFPNANHNQNSDEGKGMTQEQIDKLVDAKLQTTLNDVLSRRDSAVLDLLEVREFHMNKFKSPMDVKAFESAWKEHPEWGGSLKQAYKSYVEPEIKKAEETEWNAKIEAKYQEGIRDGFSRKQLPTDHQSKTFSPFFDRKEEVGKLSEGDQERHSREAFFEGLREPSKQTA